LNKLLVLLFLLFPGGSIAQNVLRAIIRDERTKQPLPGATLYMPQIKEGSTAGENGLTNVIGIPKGIFQVQASFIGYKTSTRTISFPLEDPHKIIYIDLEPQEGQLREVIVQSTRTNQNLRSIPTRVEVLGSEELEEEGTMKPGDIKKLLGETTGINIADFCR